jgi:hypothetical protein
MWFWYTTKKKTGKGMSKKMCKKDKESKTDKAKYRCKGCDRTARKESKLCKPKEL